MPEVSKKTQALRTGGAQAAKSTNRATKGKGKGRAKGTQSKGTVKGAGVHARDISGKVDVYTPEVLRGYINKFKGMNERLGAYGENLRESEAELHRKAGEIDAAIFGGEVHHAKKQLTKVQLTTALLLQEQLSENMKAVLDVVTGNIEKWTPESLAHRRVKQRSKDLKKFMKTFNDVAAKIGKGEDPVADIDALLGKAKILARKSGHEELGEVFKNIGILSEKVSAHIKCSTELVDALKKMSKDLPGEKGVKNVELIQARAKLIEVKEKEIKCVIASYVLYGVALSCFIAVASASSIVTGPMAVVTLGIGIELGTISMLSGLLLKLFSEIVTQVYTEDKQKVEAEIEELETKLLDVQDLETVTATLIEFMGSIDLENPDAAPGADIEETLSAILEDLDGRNDVFFDAVAVPFDER